MNNILIGADLVPTESNKDLFVSGSVRELLGEELLQLIQNAQLSIFNLEVPLADKETPIQKCGPNLIAPTNTIEGYKAMGVGLLTISNNHILDQGESGFVSTVETLSRAGIDFVGGSYNIKDAIKPYIFDFAEKRVGVYACCEHEFSVATETRCGANPFDPLESLDHIVELKKCCDYVIVLYHGGKEHYRYPSPRLQKVCRKLVDKGADLVICQHSHCIGCEEKYKFGTIVYGQGNFLFDRSNSEYWRTSLLVILDENFNTSFLPLVKEGNRVRLADDKNKTEILDSFFRRSQEIQEAGFIERKYAEFANEAIDEYLVVVGARNSLLSRVINRLTHGWLNKKKIQLLYSKNSHICTLNFIECEAHQELFIQGLKNKLY